MEIKCSSDGNQFPSLMHIRQKGDLASLAAFSLETKGMMEMDVSCPTFPVSILSCSMCPVLKRP